MFDYYRSQHSVNVKLVVGKK